MRAKSKKRILFSALAVLLALAVIIPALLDTSISADAIVNSGNTNTQTGYNSIADFQYKKWTEIIQTTFTGGGINGQTVPSVANVQNNVVTVNSGSPYFGWAEDLDSSVAPWNGTTAALTSTSETISYAGDSVKGGDGRTYNANAVTKNYTVYNVSNAAELKAAMNHANDTTNVKINLTNDIDLNGSSQFWTPIAITKDSGTQWTYIEGNGHTIYNMKTASNTMGAAFISCVGSTSYNTTRNTTLIMKNLNFSNCLVFSTFNGIASNGVVIGHIAGRAYLENVNIKKSFVYSAGNNNGTLVGRLSTTRGDTFIRNCSSSNCYVKGTAHSGGLTGCQHNIGTNYKVKYNAAFPESPEAWYGGVNDIFPEMVENSYSVDCEVYSFSGTGNIAGDGDSGGFLSCGSNLICRNCFTNNTVYADIKTGAFFGRVVTKDSNGAGLYDDKNTSTRNVQIYFENCFAYGSIEGQSQIGGFVAFEDVGTSNGGISVYKNCYTTALVGMDYAGDYLGGFIGHESTGSNGKKATIIIGEDENGSPIYNTSDGTINGTAKKGSVYINCYAAGEVGNILTDTNVEQKEKGYYNYLGGFLGVSQDGPSSTNGVTKTNDPNNNATYVNCYYDMQTTAMRERAAGRADNYKASGAEPSQIPGVSGVYTQKSAKKGIEGLADSVDMGDDSAWRNDTKDDMYPVLKAFYDEDNRNVNFGTAYYSTTATDAEKDSINAQLSDKSRLVRKCAEASASTVLLDHWDITMNMNTGTIGDETRWQPGLPQNQLEKKEYASEEEKWKYDDDNLYWEITYENLAAGKYEFKIQQGTAWAYNFGSNKFGGDNCVLNVPTDCNVRLRFDYIGQVSESADDTVYQIWADYIDKDTGELIDTQILGENSNAAAQSTYTVTGSFSGWDPANEKFDMHYVGKTNFSFTTELEAGEYEFKIAKSHAWGESYGKSGKDDNMQLKLSQACRVTFNFDEDTKLTTVTADPQEALEYVKTELETIPFKGYSVIFSDDQFTGYQWLAGLESVEAGALSDEDGDGVYTATLTVSRYDEDGVDYFNNTVFGYKVIKDAIDEGRNYHFSIYAENEDVTEAAMEVAYNSLTQQTTITTDTPGVTINNKPSATYYGVLGTEALTGHNWDENNYEAQRMSVDETNTIWTQTFTNVAAGDHAFKIAGDGTFASGISFGSSDGGNFSFTTTKTSNITITFNSDTEHISVKSNPSDAIVTDSYVVCGNSYLTGVNKVADSADNVMGYDENTGLYTKTYENLTPTIDNTESPKNYVFKIVKFGQNDTNPYVQFTIKEYSDPSEKFKLIIEYDAITKTTEFKLYNSENEDVTATALAPTNVRFYSVAGDTALTGYSWLEDTSDEAMQALKMDLNEDGVYTKIFQNVAVSATTTNLAFKVVADGTWDSGIDYGNYRGGNYIISLVSEEVTSCNVIIKFDEKIGEISVSTDPDCMASIDETEFEWFLCGDEAIVSEDAYKAPKTIYDTVRDIISPFEFTSSSSGQNISWAKDYSEGSRNLENEFYSQLGVNGEGFDIDYTVEGHNITGNFAASVITLEQNTATDEEGNQYTKYSCSRFTPGKQWVTVTASDDDNELSGTRCIRLIPTSYLEAGNDATVRVFQSLSDTNAQNVKNIVAYDENSTDGITFDGLSGTLFKNYNFALTASYAVTDRNGIGYYGNYSKQQVQKYDSSKLRANVLNTANATSYFVMTSAFAQTADYDDTDIAEGKTTNLAVDELVEQTLIGSSYSAANAEDKDKAKTIVKIFKVDSSGNESKVNMDSSSDSTSEYHENYLKWTGQKVFDSDDDGEYNVRYYWSLSDGRYMTDTKKVYINSEVSEIKKEVSEPYVEKGGSSEIKYKVTYTNKTAGDFTILDVLPFDGDIRFDDSQEGRVNSSSMNNSSFTLTDYKITYSSGKTEGLTSYYSTADSVKSYISNDDGSPSENAATKVSLSDGNWIGLSSDLGSGIENITALAVKGTQTADEESEIVIEYTLRVNAQIEDYYVNNAHFTFSSADSSGIYGDDNDIYGYSGAATTAVVSSGVNGYVWYDSNLNGKYDSNELPISNVKVSLVDYNNEANVIKSFVTGDDGYYGFDDITVGGQFKVIFSANSDSDGGNVKIGDETFPFDSLELSRTLTPYYATSAENSRNIAKAVSAGAATDKRYYIDEAMPSGIQIYSNNNQRDIFEHGSISKYNFTRAYQNLGLRPALEDKDCSLTVKKVDSSTDNPLEGVKFMLEYQPIDEDDFMPLYVKQVTDPDGKINYEFTDQTTGDGVILAEAILTDDDGLIKFTNLPSEASYRLTEVAALNGYNMLAEPLEFALPYYIENEDGTTSDGLVTGDEATKSGEYYYDVAFKVTNSKLPPMPIAGVENNFMHIIIAVILFLIVAVCVVIWFKRKNTINREEKQ